MPIFRKERKGYTQPSVIQDDPSAILNINNIPSKIVNFSNDIQDIVNKINLNKKDSLQSVSNKTRNVSDRNDGYIRDTNLMVLTPKVSDYPVPIFIGSPCNPRPEFLYHDPSLSKYSVDELKQFCDYKNCQDYDPCEDTFIFANISPKRSDRGVVIKEKVDSKEAPNYAVEKTTQYNVGDSQIIFTTQRDKEIEIRAATLNILSSLGKGISVIDDTPEERDTWFNGNSEKYVINGVSNGYTRYGYNVGERYKWSFGSVYFFKSFGSSGKTPYSITSNDGIREIWGYKVTNEDIHLIGWNYDLISGLVKEKTERPLDEKKVYGRQIYTYFIKSFEAGKCIRIEEDNGAIIINFDSKHNGDCCSPLETQNV